MPALRLLRPDGRYLLVRAELKGVTAPGPVDDIARDFQCRHYLPDALHVIAYFLGEKVWLCPGLAEDLRHGEVPVGMIEEELEELKLSDGQRCLPTLVADHSTFRIQPEAVQIPDASVPKVEPFPIAVHLALDDLYVRLGRPLRDRR